MNVRMALTWIIFRKPKEEIDALPRNQMHLSSQYLDLKDI